MAVLLKQPLFIAHDDILSSGDLIKIVYLQNPVFFHILPFPPCRFLFHAFSALHLLSSSFAAGCSARIPG